MKSLTAEWVAQAEGDLVSASRELRARKSPNYDAACFHAQQCAKKYLKALLQETGVAFPRTHDLVTPAALALSVPRLGAIRRDLRRLGAHAVTFRYPATGRTTRSRVRQSRSAVRCAGRSVGC